MLVELTLRVTSKVRGCKQGEGHVEVMGLWSTYKHEELVTNYGDSHHHFTLRDAH